MFIKKIAAISATMILLLTSSVFGSDLYTVYDLSEETRLSTGITYERIEKYTSQGWMNINVVRTNLTDPYTKVEPVTNKEGVSNRGTLSSMLKSSGAVAGVNGDFFYMGNPTYTYGPIIKDGEIITSPLPYSYGYPSVTRLLDGTVDISLWNPNITLYGSDDIQYDIVVMNKTSNIDWGPTILTSDWNKMSPGYSGDKDILEVVVVNNTVSEVRRNQPSTIIPEEGYIVASCNPDTIEKMTNSFKSGQPVSLNIELDFNTENIDWSFGGLNHLVKNGEINDISDEVLGAHPRTAIGFNKDNTEMILVTVDGRNKEYTSIKQTELAQIMVDLGAYNVVNMDGGGSTTMGIDFLKNSNITIVNMPSDGYERKIASGVGVFNTAPDSNNVDKINITTSNNKVFNNTELELDLEFLNEYYTPLDIDKSNVSYSVTPSTAGVIENNKFLPKNPGKALITASIGDTKGEIEIDVIDTPVALKFNSDNLVLNYGETHNLNNILGIDKNGNSAYIPSEYINYTYRNKIGKVEDGIFTAGDINNTGAITATFGSAIKNIQVKVGYRYETLNRFENLNNLKLNLYPEDSKGNISITDNIVKEGANALKLDYDFTDMTDQSIAFVDFGKDGEGIKLDGKPKAIGMWVYGDGKDHWLRCRVTDSYGTQTKITFEDEVNWTGWKWVTADIPDGIAYPITLNNIYLAEINETRKDTGTIYIDNLRLMHEPRDKNLGLKTETEFIDPLKVSNISNYSEKLTIKENDIVLTDSNGNSISSDNILYFDAIVTSGTLNASNTVMWNNIKSMPNYEDKVIILTMNNSLQQISDEREIKILKNILEQTSINNDVFVVWQGENESTYLENNIRYIKYDSNFEIGLTKNGVAYTN